MWKNPPGHPRNPLIPAVTLNPRKRKSRKILDWSDSNSLQHNASLFKFYNSNLLLEKMGKRSSASSASSARAIIVDMTDTSMLTIPMMLSKGDRQHRQRDRQRLNPVRRGEKASTREDLLTMLTITQQSSHRDRQHERSRKFYNYCSLTMLTIFFPTVLNAFLHSSENGIERGGLLTILLTMLTIQP